MNELTSRTQLLPGEICSRSELALRMGLTDREMRRRVRDLRRSGVPILAVKKGGYKLAQTPQEWDALIAMYIHRGLDELETAAMLRDQMEKTVCGQMSVEELSEVLAE